MLLGELMLTAPIRRPCSLPLRSPQNFALNVLSGLFPFPSFVFEMFFALAIDSYVTLLLVRLTSGHRTRDNWNACVHCLWMTCTYVLSCRLNDGTLLRNER